MVAPAPLGFDIVSVVLSTIVPGIAWALLFLLAWRRGPFAESIGLGRREFWLLLPGALAASFAILPLLPVSSDVLALSFSGALFPLLVGTLALRRVAPPVGRSARTLFALLAIESVVMLVPVVPAMLPAISSVARAARLDAGVTADLLDSLLAIVVCAGAAGALGFGRDAWARKVLAVFLTTSAVMLLTFLGSTAIPGVGIVEGFPYFLLPPFGAGLALGGLARQVFPGEMGFALPVSFFAGSWGTLLGADLLREPGLYGHGPAGLYVIGGAGVLDLVYLSGFLALAGAYAAHYLFERSWEPVGAPIEPALPNPAARLRVAYDRGLRGDLRGSLQASSEAASAAAEEARRLRGVPPGAPTQRPWDGLPVPSWVVSDHANLDSVARAGTREPVEALRGWMTARWLVRAGADLSRPRFASLPQRIAAFLIDLTIVLVAAGAILAALAFAVPGSLDDLLGGLGYNTAIYACLAGSFLYFVLAERWAGVTIGKRALRLEVRDRSFRPPDGVAALVRNVSLLPILTLAVLGVAVAAAIVVKGFAAVTVGGIGVPAGLFALSGIAGFVAGGVALFGAVGVLAIGVTFERQRIGDVWAGTWVVRALSSPGPGAPASPTGPPAPDRSA